MIKNIKQHKFTSGTGIAFLAIFILDLCGFNLEEKLGISSEGLMVGLGGAISAILLLFSKDPKQNKNEVNKEV